MGFFSKFATATFAIYIFAYVSKIALLDFQNEPISLDVKEVCFEEERYISNNVKTKGKFKVLLNGVDVEMRCNPHKCRVLELQRS